MSRIPPIDLHAHIKPDIASSELTAVESLVFAATRSLAEGEQVTARDDPWTIWGVGCHPGLARAQKAFSSGRFSDLIATTPSVNQVGFDGMSRLPIAIQLHTFEGILDVLQDNPRITSIHSTGATQPILDSLEKRPIRGAVLHWWLGDEEQTRRAVGMGCYFSVNSSMLRHNEILDLIPPDRVLTETTTPSETATPHARGARGTSQTLRALWPGDTTFRRSGCGSSSGAIWQTSWPAPAAPPNFRAQSESCSHRHRLMGPATRQRTAPDRERRREFTDSTRDGISWILSIIHERDREALRDSYFAAYRGGGSVLQATVVRSTARAQ